MTIQMHVDPAAPDTCQVQLYTFAHNGEKYVYVPVREWSGPSVDMPADLKALLNPTPKEQ